MAENNNENIDERKEGTAEVKGKFSDILSLINNAFSGKMFIQEDGTHEIYFEASLHSMFISIFIKREEIDRQRFTTISVKQGLLKNKIVKNILTFKDLRKVYISITPGSDVVFLFTEFNRYTVLNIFKDANVDIVNSIDRRGENDEIEKQAEILDKNRSFYEQANMKKKDEINKRRIFISL